MIDLIRQRRRILFGHIQVKRLLGKAPRTVETMMFFSPSQSVKIVIRMLANKPRRILVLPVAAMGELLALAGALWDTFVSKRATPCGRGTSRGLPTARIKGTIAIVVTKEANENLFQRRRDDSMSLTLTERQQREIEAFCKIARENGAAISLRELIELAAIDASELELEMAFHSDYEAEVEVPARVRVRASRGSPPSRELAADGRGGGEEERARAAEPEEGEQVRAGPREWDRPRLRQRGELVPLREGG